MAEGKKSFVFYLTQRAVFFGLSDEDAGRLIKIIFDYCGDKNPEIPKDLAYPFNILKETLKASLDTYTKRREAGQKGGIQRALNQNQELSSKSKQCLDNQANLSKPKQNQVNQADIDIDIVKDIEKDIDIGISNEIDNICAEIDDTISTLPAVKCPKGHEDGYKVSSLDVFDYQQVYTGVDVEYELKKMELWLKANPKNRKTYNGMPKFINNWLSRAQDNASKFNRNNQAPATPEQPQLMNGGFEMVDTKSSETPYEVANTIKTLHLNDKQLEQWLSSYSQEFAEEVKKYLEK